MNHCWKWRLWLAVVALVACISAPGRRAEAAADRPNVLFIAVDDLRPELGCYGRTHIKSPHVDRLARSGVLFRRAYCQQAVCGATRTSLLTGLRPDTTRIYGNSTYFRDRVPDVVTLPQQFKNHGYHVVGMGKVYHQNDPPSWSEPWQAFPGLVWRRPDNLEIIERKRAEAEKRGLKGKALGRAARGPATEWADVPDNAYPEGAVADTAIETLRRIKDRPFFLAVGFIRPHLPFNCPKKYWDLYDRDQIRLPSNRSAPKGAPELALTSWGELRSYHGIPPKGPVTDEQALELIHGYYACVSYTDAQIGRVVDELERLELRKSTIIILWGDHGWKLGEYSAWCKHTNFELDAHAPLILAAPGAKAAGRSCDALVEFIDIYPTLCDLAGLPLPDHLEGTSFAPLLADPDQPWKTAAFSQYPRGKVMGRSMRTDRYRFTLWTQAGDMDDVVAVELYDHQEDPGENVNVAGDPENRALVEKLTAKLRAGWREALPPAASSAGRDRRAWKGVRPSVHTSDLLAFRERCGSADAVTDSFELTRKFAGSELDEGKIVAFEENRFLMFAVRETAGREALPPPLDHGRLARRFVFLKPSTFVVDDQVRQPAEGGPAEWSLRSPREPEITGDRVRIVEPGGEILCETLLPENATRQSTTPSGQQQDGYVVTEVAPRADSGCVRFLHVIHTRAPGEEAPAARTTKLVREGETLRLTISTPDRVYRLTLPPLPADAGEIGVADVGGKALMEPRLLPSGILPHGPDGVRLLDRWDSAYRGGRAGWDTGRPSSELKQAVEQGKLQACRVVELGCGTGTNAVYLAGQGFEVTGIDIAPTALKLAQQKAEKAGVEVRWVLADVLAPPQVEPFDLIYDRGCYHGVRRQNAAGYVEALRRLSRPGTRVLILAGNANEPKPHRGPPRVTEEEVRADFSADFEIEWLRETRFDNRDGDAKGALAWSILLRRKGGG